VPLCDVSSPGDNRTGPWRSSRLDDAVHGPRGSCVDHERKRLTTAARYSLPVRVYWEDTDGAGVVYYANYLRFMERARTEWLRDLGFEQTRLVGEFDIGFVVRSAAIEYLRPARLDDLLTVVAEVQSVGASVIVFRQSVMRGEEAVSEAVVRIACVRISSFRPARIPRELRAALAK
jgi:acyl-CoA thioester hydrolase